MFSRIKQYFWIALAIAVFYFLLNNHFLFSSLTSFDLLKKEELTFKYTFFSIIQNSPEKALRIDELRNAGIGEYYLEKGMLTEEKLDKILFQIEAEQN